jgi:hypothetical protein
LKADGYLKRPDAALRFILRHCGVRKVRLIPHDLRALPAALLTKPSYLASFSTFYEFIIHQNDGRTPFYLMKRTAGAPIRARWFLKH